jgi:hypothetical protein
LQDQFGVFGGFDNPTEQGAQRTLYPSPKSHFVLRLIFAKVICISAVKTPGAPSNCTKE